MTKSEAEHLYTEKLADFMHRNSFATGHGDTFDQLLHDLEGQINEIRKRNDMLRAKVFDVLDRT